MRTDASRFLKPTLIALVLAASLNGCASTRAFSASGARQPRAGVVDYAGHPCGNQNMHVKMPVCLFPRAQR